MATQQAEAKKIMESLGYGPNTTLKLKIATRDFASYKDPAVILVDQRDQIHFDTEMEIVESSIWHSRLIKKDYSVGMNTPREAAQTRVGTRTHLGRGRGAADH